MNLLFYIYYAHISTYNTVVRVLHVQYYVFCFFPEEAWGDTWSSVVNLYKVKKATL